MKKRLLVPSKIYRQKLPALVIRQK